MGSDNQKAVALGPSKLNDQLMDIFCRLVAMGNYYRACCNAVGITTETFNNWMRYGRAAVSDDDPYRRFYIAVKRADAEAEVFAVRKWKSHFEYDYRAARDFLARRYPERWGSRHFVAVAVDREIEKMLNTLQGTLAPEEFTRVVRALAGAATNEAEEIDEVDSLLDEDAAFSFQPAVLTVEMSSEGE